MTLLVTLLVLSAAGLPLAPPSEAAPMFELSMAIVPEEVDLFPTYAQIGRLQFQGTVRCNKTRPDEIRVFLEASADVDWDFRVQPEILVFHGVGERIAQFSAYLSVPPRTAGPPVVQMDYRAYAELAGRTEECTARSFLYIVQDVHGFVDSFPTVINVPPDRGVDGTAYIENMLDEELIVHLSATGGWEELIPDLDFQQFIILEPYEQRPARFHGSLSPSVEPGDYLVEMALWTPGPDEERTIITTVNVTLSVSDDLEEGLGGALMRLAFPIFLLACASLALLTYWFLRRKDRADARNHNR